MEFCIKIPKPSAYMQFTPTSPSSSIFRKFPEPSVHIGNFQCNACLYIRCHNTNTSTSTLVTFVLYTADCTIQQIALNKTTQTISLKSFFFCLVFSSFVALLRPDLRVVNGKVYNACKLYLWLVIYLLLTKQKFCLHSIFIFLAVNSSLPAPGP